MSETTTAAAGKPSQSVTQNHTPGPWIYHGDALQVIDSDVPGPGAPEGICICDMNPCDFIPEAGVWRYQAVTEANARLIAAAPDLLALLRRLLPLLDSDRYATIGNAWASEAVAAAIAKVEGRL